MRRFLDDIRGEVAVRLADNNTGNITPLDIRTLLNDIIDSTINDEGAIYLTGNVINVPVTTGTQAVIGYSDESGGDGNFIRPDFATGIISGSNVAGYTYEIVAEISFTGGNNDVYEFLILEDGVESDTVSSVTARGGSRPQSAIIRDFNQSAPADVQYQLGVRSPDGGGDITVSSLILRIDVKPTNNAD